MEITSELLGNRFTYHQPDESKAEKHAAIRNVGLLTASVIAELCPDTRERSIAIDRIDEGVMWANAAISRAA